MSRIETLTLPSAADGLPLSVCVVEPEDGAPRALVQFAHGMAEHKERYLPFMEFLAEHGFASIINDHRGHGASVKDPGDLGYFYKGGAKALVDEMQVAIDEIAAKGATIQEKKRVAVEVAALPYLCYAGGNTYLDEMIRLIGAENAYGDSDPWASVTEEAAVATNPDVILTCISYLDDPVGEIMAREGWGEVAAIANGQVYRLDDESSNQPNHRIVNALREMAEAVYPEVYGKADAAA